MGLDVYVGTLTRYFTHDWETIRRGLAMFTELATKAVEHRLPMKLDY